MSERPDDTALIYHIAAPADWAAAQQHGEYAISTRGRTLAEEGFIHACTAAQLAWVADTFYRGATDLLVLVIDTGLVRPLVRFEALAGATEAFPHIYGPLNTDAVTATRPL